MSTAFDYSGLQSTATALINRFGRPMTLTRDSRVPDPSKPWLTEQGDPADAAAQSIDTVGVNVGLDREGREAQTVERRLAAFLIRADAAIPEQLGTDWKVVDAGSTYAVVIARPIEPGGTLMLYRLTVAL